MMAEVMVDVLDDAVGVKEKFGNDGPPDCRAIDIGASRVQGTEAWRSASSAGRPGPAPATASGRRTRR